jgi:hypothetical protein
MSNDYEALQNFIGGHFHEDWSLDDASPREVVQRFFRDHDSIEDLAPVFRALRELIEVADDDAVLSSRLLKEFDSYYHPSNWGLSTRVWLQTLAADFEGEIKARSRLPQLALMIVAPTDHAAVLQNSARVRSSCGNRDGIAPGQWRRVAVRKRRRGRSTPAP